jgi:hypothetical protein
MPRLAPRSSSASLRAPVAPQSAPLASLGLRVVCALGCAAGFAGAALLASLCFALCFASFARASRPAYHSPSRISATTPRTPSRLPALSPATSPGPCAPYPSLPLAPPHFALVTSPRLCCLPLRPRFPPALASPAIPPLTLRRAAGIMMRPHRPDGGARFGLDWPVHPCCYPLGSMPKPRSSATRTVPMLCSANRKPRKPMVVTPFLVDCCQAAAPPPPFGVQWCAHQAVPNLPGRSWGQHPALVCRRDLCLALGPRAATAADSGETETSCSPPSFVWLESCCHHWSTIGVHRPTPVICHTVTPTQWVNVRPGVYVQQRE